MRDGNLPLYRQLDLVPTMKMCVHILVFTISLTGIYFDLYKCFNYFKQIFQNELGYFTNF